MKASFASTLKLRALARALGLMAQQIRSGTTLGSFAVGTESTLGSRTVGAGTALRSLSAGP